MSGDYTCYDSFILIPALVFYSIFVASQSIHLQNMNWTTMKYYFYYGV